MITTQNETPDWALTENVKEMRTVGEAYLAPNTADDALFVDRDTNALGEGQSALSIRPGSGVVGGTTLTLNAARSVDIAKGGGQDRRDVVYLTDDGSGNPTLAVAEGQEDPFTWGDGVDPEEETIANAYRPAPPDLAEITGLALAVIHVPRNTTKLQVGAITPIRAPPPAGGGGGASKPQIGLMIPGGQSNEVGKGDQALSPDLPADVAVEVLDGEVSPLSDPIGAPDTSIPGADSTVSDTGSSIPAFAKRYYELTGERTAYALAAVGSTAQSSTGDTNHGSWDADGDLRSRLVSIKENAMETLRGAGYDPIFRGILWSQGENDARGGVAEGTYASAARTMLDYYDSQFAPGWGFHIFQTGMPRSGDTADWQAIRRAQRELANDPAYPMADMVSTIQKSFPAEGLMHDGDMGELHYKQEGYNRMGVEGAEHLAGLDAERTAGAWTDKLNERATETTYQNTTGRRVDVSVRFKANGESGSQAIGASLSVSPRDDFGGFPGGVADSINASNLTTTTAYVVTASVPDGHYYRVDNGSINEASIDVWNERVWG